MPHLPPEGAGAGSAQPQSAWPAGCIQSADGMCSQACATRLSCALSRWPEPQTCAAWGRAATWQRLTSRANSASVTAERAISGELECGLTEIGVCSSSARCGGLTRPPFSQRSPSLHGQAFSSLFVPINPGETPNHRVEHCLDRF